jgi:hypothetical protein
MNIEKYLPYLLIAAIAVSVLAAVMVNHWVTATGVKELAYFNQMKSAHVYLISVNASSAKKEK